MHQCSSPPDQHLLRERLQAASTTVVGSFSRKLSCCSCVRTSTTTAAVLAWTDLTAESPSSRGSEEAVSAGEAEVKEVPADALLLVGLAFGWLPPLGALARARLWRRDLARRSAHGRALCIRHFLHHTCRSARRNGANSCDKHV